MEQGAQVVIRKLRLHSNSEISASGRGLPAWIKQTLHEAELEPPEMPPSAVLLVRRLEGRLRRHAGVSRAEAASWQSEVRNKIGQRLAQASRPVRGDLPSEAEAVLFRDPAEMAASLIWDVARGVAAERWWWQSAIGDPAALRELPLAFVREPRHIPAAVAYLIDWGRAEQVAISLSAKDARMIAVRVCGAFGLTRLLALLMGSTDAAEDELSLEGLRVNARLDGPRSAHEEDGTRTSSGDARFLEGSKVEAVEGPGDERPRLERRENGHGHPAPGSGARGQERSSAGPSHAGLLSAAPENDAKAARPARAPWRSSVSEWWERVGKDRAALFGVAQSLARSPHKVRTDAFVADFSAWWRQTLPHERPGGLRPGARPSDANRFEASARERALRSTTPDALASGPDRQRHIGDREEALERLLERGPEVAGAGAEALPIGPVDGLGSRQSDRPVLPVNDAASAAADGNEGGRNGSHFESMGSAAETDASDELFVSRPGDSKRAIEGAAATQIEAKDRVREADATPPAASDVQDPWNSEHGCATELGGLLYLQNAMKRLGIPECFEADWGLDAALGRWGCLQALGIGLLIFARNRIQSAARTDHIWFDPIWRLLAELEGREPDQPLGAGVLDPGAFVVPKAWDSLLGRDVAIDRRPVTAVNVELQIAELPFPITAPLVRWMAFVAPYLAEYIRVAAGPLASHDFDPAALLFVRGRIYATKSHVDLVADLDQISLAARVAGLDANPGWDPHFGRVVQFHFR